MLGLSKASQIVWLIGANEAFYAKHQYIEIDHIFIGICKIIDLPLEEVLTKLKIDTGHLKEIDAEVNRIKENFEEFNISPVSTRQTLRGKIGTGDTEPAGQVLHRSPQCRNFFKKVETICKNREGSIVELLDFLLAITQEENTAAYEILIETGIDLSAFQFSIIEKTKVAPEKENPEVKSNSVLIKEKGVNLPAEKEEGTKPKVSATPFLNKYGRDLTQLAREGKIDHIIGRKEEIKKIAQILCQKRKNNPILVGDAGVGKTCVVEGLAQKIVSPEAPSQIKDKRIVEISMSTMVAGTKYRGEFEERLQKILNEAKNNKNVVIFIDELHTIMGAGSAGEGSMDAANILKPALARGDICCIGATTTQEYRKHIEKDAALSRRFQMVWIDEPTKEEAIEIIEGLRNAFESHHGIKISDEAIKGAVEFSMRYLNDFRLPDKAIDLIDQACAQQKLKSLTVASSNIKKVSDGEEFVIGYKDIAEVISQRCRIPLERLVVTENDRLLRAEEELGKRVIGQDVAIKEVCQVIRTAKAGLEDPRKPLGVFLFLGSTGIGKTELAKALAEFLFDDENKLISFDMSEYMEKHNVSKLIGAPPGYVGYEEEGQLTGKIRTNPYSVVLFDEIEKAHLDINGIFLQIFDEGKLTDSQGRRVDFRNTIIIMTSNMGTGGLQREKQKQQIGVPVSEDKNIIPEFNKEQYQRTIQEAVKQYLRPELLSRIRKVIIFYPLEKKDLKKVIDKLLGKVAERLKNRNLRIEAEESIYDILIESGYSQIYGVREMERTIEELISTPLANTILEGGLRSGQTVRIKGEAEKIIFETSGGG